MTATDNVSTDREMPHSLDAEAGVLGSIILNHNLIDNVLGQLSCDDFYSAANGIIYDALVGMSETQQPIDRVTLKNELVRRGKLDLIGGVATLAALESAVPHTANVDHYSAIVKDKSTLRRLITAAGEIGSECYSASRAAHEVLDSAETEILKIGGSVVSEDTVPIHKAIKNVFDQFIEAKASGDTAIVTGLSSGFWDLDRLTTGFHEDELIIVAGRPGMGKSTLAINFLVKVGVEQRKPCALFSLEMTAENIARNMLCGLGQLRSEKVRSATLNKQELAEFHTTIDKLSQAPIFITFNPSLSLGSLRGSCRRLKRMHDIQMVIVDYLQLLSAPDGRRDQNRQEEISRISRGLKQLSGELGIPVIALSQLNRGVESRSDHEPMLSDLREPGAIEQDADVVILVNRPEYYSKREANEPPPEVDTATIKLAKQRNGPPGKINLTFFGPQFRFEPMARHEEDRDSE